MHPAYSVILFTTASGAGYGLLVWLCVGVLVDGVPADRGFGFFGLGLALTLVTTGLLSSLLHLGRPERAWRAFSQWRSSWLSREGVAAVATYVPAGLLGIGWVFFGDITGFFAICAALVIVGAAVTVWCTGMIYASLRTIRQWCQPLTAPIYVGFALATGGLLYNALAFAFRHGDTYSIALAFISVAIAFALKAYYWLTVDADKGGYTVGQATGLGRFGIVRVLDPPHTGSNFVMDEMGYKVGRKHASVLRLTAVVLGCFVPLILLAASLVAPPATAPGAAILAVMSSAIGTIVERWLFFAQAEHVVTLFYGADRA